MNPDSHMEGVDVEPDTFAQDSVAEVATETVSTEVDRQALVEAVPETIIKATVTGISSAISLLRIV